MNFSIQARQTGRVAQVARTQAELAPAPQPVAHTLRMSPVIRALGRPRTPLLTRALVAAQALLLTLALGGGGGALAEVAVPPLKGHVTDQTGTLTGEQKATLEQTLQAFEARKGSQIAVLMVNTTAPEAIEQYSLRVVEQWKLGRKKVDDGALLLVAKNDRTMRIEVGYGLEGALNDATAKRIIAEVITPAFKQGDFYGGITAGVGRMISVVDGEPLPPPAAGQANPGSQQGDGASGIGSYVPVIFILAIVVGGVLRAMFGRVPGALITGGITAVLAWLVIGGITISVLAGVIALFVTLFGGGLGGLIGGMGGGRGGGGGGYSGGGGGFGGGGASGKW